MTMHPLEIKLAELLAQGEVPTVALLGGTSALLSAARDIAGSQLMPELLKIVTSALQDASSPERDELAEFVCKCVETATDDFVLMETVDILDGCRPLPGKGDDRCFNRFLALASDTTMNSMARAAALDGAFRLAVSERRHQLQLLVFLLGVQKDEDPIFLTRAAKIMGVAYSHWREDVLIKQLRVLTEIEGVGNEAAFELAMARLTDGLEMDDREKAAEAFDSARHWFAVSAERREQRPDATAYLHCLDVLTAFSRGEKYDQVAALALSIADAAFQMDAWHIDQEGPPWLGARHVESTCWNMLALKLRSLSAHLDEASWWEPSVVLEQYVVASYVASRSILRRSHIGGVEAVVRPNIEGALARREGQAYALKKWLTYNTSYEWAEAAQELSQQIDALITGEHTNLPIEAAIIWPPVAALLEKARIPENDKGLAIVAITDALSLHLENLSTTEIALIEKCLSVVSQHKDYRKNPQGKRLFNTVLTWTIRFLNYRLEMTQGHDSGVAYLFERDDHTLPHEEALQADYHRFMFSNIAGTEIEVSDIGGGRADVRFLYGGERLIVEVKREDADCSFDALARTYAAQATEYQNVSIRLGVLLVLDQTEIRKGGTPHISTLVRVSEIMRKDEITPRLLMIVKVPGRRLRPSDLKS